MIEQKVCVHCGKTFYRGKRSAGPWANAQFCSRECMYKGRGNVAKRIRFGWTDDDEAETPLLIDPQVQVYIIVALSQRRPASSIGYDHLLPVDTVYAIDAEFASEICALRKMSGLERDEAIALLKTRILKRGPRSFDSSF